MKKTKKQLDNAKFVKAIVFALIFNLFFTNFAFAITSKKVEIIEPQSKYPDYVNEFTGRDKFESFNRKIFVFNLKANKYIIRPVNIVWSSVMPTYGMDRINNAYTNLRYPARLVGSLLQGDKESARIETKRFFINTILGIGGLYDVAMSKYKIIPHREDMGQAFRAKNIKQGPYLVLPIVAQGNIRDIGGQAFDVALNPASYLFWLGPISMISGGVSFVNNATYLQPVFKLAENYPDSYIISKQALGLERYIRYKNIDRQVFLTPTPIDNKETHIKKIGNLTQTKLNADVRLDGFNPQGKETDSIRTMLFDSQNLGKSVWNDLSIWNKSFKKKIKFSSISVDKKRDDYKFRYILQKDKTSPLAILYPSIGEGVQSNQSNVFAKLLYDKGYSVIILGSSFSWEFAKSMPKGFAPGLPYNDAKYLRIVTQKAINKIEKKHKKTFGKRVLVGTSFGALTGLFVAKQEDEENTINFDKFVFISPPINIFYALNQIDGFANNYLADAKDYKEEIAIAAKKIIDVSYYDYDKHSGGKVILPLEEKESELIISFMMRLKLYNLIFTLENGSLGKKNDIYKQFNNISFNDYAQKYLIKKQTTPLNEIIYNSSLYSISDFLKSHNNYKIYHSLNDCFTERSQLAWLKSITGKKTVLIDNGSHLGFLYRPEFSLRFKDDIRY